MAKATPKVVGPVTSTASDTPTPAASPAEPKTATRAKPPAPKVPGPKPIAPKIVERTKAPQMRTGIAQVSGQRFFGPDSFTLNEGRTISMPKAAYDFFLGKKVIRALK